MAPLIHLFGVAGCDEAGRGPLAGPVVCAAVVLPEGFDSHGLNDSKKMSRHAREHWEQAVKSHSDWSVVLVGPDEVDQLNVLQASLVGMARALGSLRSIPPRALIDGNRLPEAAPCPCEAVIKGDATFACIAAASVLAKTARDRIMIEMDWLYPGYGFAEHFGYPTADHLTALKKLGPCPIHRRSFGPVQECLAQPSLADW